MRLRSGFLALSGSSSWIPVDFASRPTIENEQPGGPAWLACDPELRSMPRVANDRGGRRGHRVYLADDGGGWGSRQTPKSEYGPATARCSPNDPFGGEIRYLREPAASQCTTRLCSPPTRSLKAARLCMPWPPANTMPLRLKLPTVSGYALLPFAGPSHHRS